MYLVYENIINSFVQKQVDKRYCGELPCPVSRRLQRHFAFSDKVCILYLFCNVTKPKTTTKLLKNERRLIVLLWFIYEVCAYDATVSYCRSSLIRSQQKLVYSKRISRQCNSTAQIEQAHSKI